MLSCFQTYIPSSMCHKIAPFYLIFLHTVRDTLYKIKIQSKWAYVIKGVFSADSKTQKHNVSLILPGKGSVYYSRNKVYCMPFGFAELSLAQFKTLFVGSVLSVW